MPSKCLLKALLRIRIQIKKSDPDPTLAGSFYRKLSSERLRKSETLLQVNGSLKVSVSLIFFSHLFFMISTPPRPFPLNIYAAQIIA